MGVEVPDSLVTMYIVLLNRHELPTVRFVRATAGTERVETKNRAIGNSRWPGSNRSVLEGVAAEAQPLRQGSTVVITTRAKQ